MKTSALAMPGIAWGSYPEREAPRPNWLAQKLESLSATVNRFRRNERQRFVERVRDQDAHMRALTAEAFAATVRDLRAKLEKQGFEENLLVDAFALVREVTRRNLGISQYDMQLLAARIMLDNRLVEMATGEGKTITALLTAATAALSGVPVHVITANDYLVQRDAEHLRPIYAALGLRVGAVMQSSTPEQRRAAYACDVTYCTAKELVFDYLKDRLMFGQRRDDLQRRIAMLNGADAAAPLPLLRGLCMALVDEADSILIDEALTPLILSDMRPDPQQLAFLDVAMNLALTLVRNRDFVLHAGRN
jgi:preprotein translocase subunit SecA